MMLPDLRLDLNTKNNTNCFLITSIVGTYTHNTSQILNHSSCPSISSGRRSLLNPPSPTPHHPRDGCAGGGAANCPRLGKSALPLLHWEIQHCSTAPERNCKEPYCYLSIVALLFSVRTGSNNYFNLEPFNLDHIFSDSPTIKQTLFVLCIPFLWCSTI